LDLKLDKLRQLCSLAAAHAAVCGAVRALGAPADAAPLVAALLPAAQRAPGVRPAAAAALEALDEARMKRERRAFTAAQVTTEEQDTAAALATPLPLWRAAQAASTGRARVALARANAMLRSLQLRRARGDAATLNAQASVAHGYAAVFMQPAADAARAAPGDFAFTVGLHHIIGAPELVVVADMPGVASELQLRIAGYVLQGAADALVAAVCAGEQDEREVAAQLCRGGAFELPDAQAGVFTATAARGPGLLRDASGGGAPLSAEACAAAAAAVVWRFVPRAEALRAHGNRTEPWCSRAGAAQGRARTTYYGDCAGVVPPEVYDLPALVCSLAACMTAAPGRVARSVYAALAGAHFSPPTSPAAASAAAAAAAAAAGCSPAEAACAAETAARAAEQDCAATGDDAAARLRAHMHVCALPGCESRVAEALLQQCGACKRAAYCSPAHQRLDWKRHKPDCTAAQAEQGVGVEADKAILEALSVHDLCARVASRGLDASGCVYKADLVRLLLATAADGAPR
jgi:hypothetical protein